MWDVADGMPLCLAAATAAAVIALGVRTEAVCSGRGLAEEGHGVPLNATSTVGCRYYIRGGIRPLSDILVGPFYVDYLPSVVELIACLGRVPSFQEYLCQVEEISHNRAV